MYLISACLAGVDCKYNGRSNENEKVVQIVKSGEAILVCPEQLGGLSTPRPPSEIIIADGNVKVISKDGEDFTKEFLKGAEETLKIAKMMNIKKAILKSKSPSCGLGKIYDGSFSNTLICGDGLTTRLLKENGIEVFDEYSLEEL